MKFSAQKLMQSVVPVIFLLSAIFLLLMYVQYRASLNADKAIHIHITAQTAMPEITDTQMDRIGEVDFSDDLRIIKAQELIHKKKYTQAENIYFEVLGKEPSSQIHNWLGVLYLKQEQYHKALVSFTNALKFNEKNYRALYNRAISHTALKQTEEAIEDYKKVIDMFDAHAKSHFNLGLLYYKKKIYKDAINSFQKTTSLTSGDKKVKALYMVAKSYSRMSPPQNEKAIAAYNATIRIKPNHIPSRLALIKFNYAKKKDSYKEELAQLNVLLSLEPDNIFIYRAIAKLHHKNKKEELRLQVLMKSLHYEPNNIELQMDIAFLLMKKNKTQKAIEMLERVLTIDPLNTKIHFLLGRLYYLQNNYEESLFNYNKVKELSESPSPELWNNLGLLYMKMKNIDKAKEVYAKALNIRKNYPEVYYNLGLLYLKSKNFEKAQMYFEKAISMRPEYPQAYYNLALIFAEEKQHEKAIESYIQVLKYNPNKVKAKLNLAVQYSKIEDYENAKIIYRKILKDDESYFIAWLNLGRINYKLGEYKSSIYELQKAVHLEPEHEKANRSLAKSYRAVKNYNKALEILKRLLEHNPADIKTRLVYARSYYRYKKYNHALREYKKVLKLDPKNKVAEKMLRRIKKKRKK